MKFKEIRLHGGPCHGILVVIPEDQNHVHIFGMLSKGKQTEEDSDSPVESIPVREGTYSQVHNETTDFEWDGWATV